MNDLSHVFKELDKHFLEYLAEHGRVPNDAGFIRCIVPGHADANPSTHIIDGGEHAYTACFCFSCRTHSTILNAVHYLEGYPISSIAFYEDTLPYLCKKYNVDYEPIQIDNKTRDIYQKRRGVKDALNVTHGMSYIGNDLNKDHIGIKHLLDRGITEQSIRKHKIGVVSEYNKYLETMNKIGYTDNDWLLSADLARKDIFTSEGFILPIYDDKNRAVGFVTRTTNLAPNGKGDRKYCNSVNSDIYNKSEILYNFNNYDPAGGPLWIVEGYLDAIYLDQCGLKNVVALGSTAFTEQHVDLLARYNVKHICLTLDGDEGGKKGTKLALERITAYQIFKSIKIIELPEGYDPDSYVREYGLDALKKLAHPDIALSPFSWSLKEKTFQDDPLVTVEEIIPNIVAEESSIKRLKMIKELAKFTGISKDDIKKEVDLKVNLESDKLIEELTDVNKYVQTALGKRKVKDTKGILEEAIVKIKNLELKYNNVLDNRSTFEDKRNTLWEKIENGEYQYGLYAPHFKKFEELYDGVPYTTNLTLIGGKPAVGKTSWLQSLAVDIVEQNEEAAIFFMTIDDTTDLMTLKALAKKTGFSTSKIKQYSKLMSEDQEIILSAKHWNDRLSSRLIMADATEGTTPDAMEAHIEWFIKEFPNKKKIFLLDNFHKLTMPPNKQKTDAVSHLSEKVKDFSRIYDIHIMMTVELRKMDHNSRPNPSDLKDTVQLEYDADSIIMIHNDLNVNENTNIIWTGQYGTEGSKAMPYLEAYVFKNKHTGKTGGLAYRLNTYNLQITEDSYATIKALKDQNAGHKKLTSGNRIN
ncbi:MAG: toprim domain-containing protein [Candidatus Omnitrophica bacterium]|jgi:DNA primase catalytic core|nr:toprim domain-containing protein [Candidatus Omnitrophota bacterium]